MFVVAGCCISGVLGARRLAAAFGRPEANFCEHGEPESGMEGDPLRCQDVVLKWTVWRACLVAGNCWLTQEWGEACSGAFNFS